MATATNIIKNLSTSDVKQLQTALQNQGYSVGSSGVDGIIGNDTQNAINSWYKDHNYSTWKNGGISQQAYDKIVGGSSTKSSSSSTNTSNGTGTTYTQDQVDALIAQKEAAAAESAVNQYKEENNSDLLTELKALYDQQNSALDDAYQQKVIAQQNATQAQIDTLNANKESVNSDYEDAQRQAYINYMTSQNQLGDYLASQGYNGGMTETSALNLANAYQNNRQTATSERDEALRNIENLVNEAQTTGNTELVNLAAEYMSNYADSLANYQSSYLNAYNLQNSIDQQNYENEWTEKTYNDEQTYQKEQDAKTEAATKAENEYNSFVNTYKTMYSTKSKYNSWITKLQNQIKTDGDPYGYLASEIQYLQAWVNSDLGTKTTTTSSSSSSGKSSSSKTYSSSSSKSSSSSSSKSSGTGSSSSSTPTASQLNDTGTATATPTSKQTKTYNNLYYQIALALQNQTGRVLTKSLTDYTTQIKNADMTEAQKQTLLNMMK